MNNPGSMKVRGHYPVPQHVDNVQEELQRIQVALSAVFSPSSDFSTISMTNDNTPMAMLRIREVADRYLTTFQHLPIAWMVCDQMLQDVPENASAAASQSAMSHHFFAAQTLHTKCREDVHQLPTSSLPSLRESLVDHFLRFSASSPPSPRALVTRLGLALSALAVQMCWTSVVSDMLDRFRHLGHSLPHQHQQEQNYYYTSAMLDLLHLLPEEAYSNRLFLINDQLQNDYRAALQHSAMDVLELLVSVLRQAEQNPPTFFLQHVEKVFLCLQTWLRYAHIPPLIMDKYFSLIHAAFHALSREELLEVAIDTIVELLRAYPTSQIPNGTSLLICQRVVPHVLSLQNQPEYFAKAMEEEDHDRLRGYCRIVTELSESCMSWILSAENGHQEDKQQTLLKDQVIDLALLCSAIPDNDIACITLNFWYRFVHNLESLHPDRYRQMQIDHYQPYLLRLLQICVTFLKYPSDIDDLRQDQIEDYERDRFYVAETVEDCCRLLGGNEILRNLGERLQQECQILLSSAASHPSGASVAASEGYHSIEACLFAFKAVARYIPKDEDKVLPFVFGTVLLQLPADVPRLRSTMDLTVGCYASWLGANSSYLQPLLPYLAQSFTIQSCASSAAVAVKQLCEYCYDPPLGEPVLELYEQLTQNRESSYLNIKDELTVLEGVCKAVARELSQSNTIDPSVMFGRIVSPIGNRLATLLATQNEVSSKSLITIASEMDRLTIIVRYLKTTQGSQKVQPSLSENLIAELMKQMWDMLDTLSMQHPNNINLAEKLCRLHKHAMRSCGALAYSPLLDPFMSQVVRNFRQSCLSPYLYGASICITEFGHDPNFVPKLYNLISELSATVFTRLTSLEDFTQHPDVVEEYFYLIGRFMTYCPEPLVLSPLFRTIIQWATVGLHIHHREANKGTLNFLENTVSFGLGIAQSNVVASDACKAAFHQAITCEGPVVVQNLALVLLGDLPAYCLDQGSGSVAGVLWKLNTLCSELVRQWVLSAIVKAPNDAKDELMKAFVMMAGRDEFNAAVRQFKSLCERSRRIQQGSLGTGVA